MKSYIATAIALLLGASFSSAAPSEHTKAPWEWTNQERLAARFDPSQIGDRDAAYATAHPQLRSSGGHRTEANAVEGGKRGVVYTIDGTRNPELLLPTELFDALLSGLQPNATMATRQRAFYGRIIKKLGYDEADFWSQLESASASYLPIRFQAGNLAVDGQPDVKCHARFIALEQARRT